MGRRRSRRPDQRAGVVLIDKPAGLTSFDVVKQVRRILGVFRAGHTGTLDPMATGVLPVCYGEATKIAALLLSDDKRYGGRARLGVETDTLDITGEVQRRADASAVTVTQLSAALAELTGPIEQVPPAYSAIHTGGRRAHELARQGETVELAPRTVQVHRFELLAFPVTGTEVELDFEVDCGKGTYVRSLVRDVGQALGCGAVLTGLRRLSSGPFAVDECVALEDLSAASEGKLSIDEALSRQYPAVEVDGDDARRLSQGQPLDLEPSLGPGGLVRVRCEGALVALGEGRRGQLWPKRVLNSKVIAST